MCCRRIALAAILLVPACKKHEPADDHRPDRPAVAPVSKTEPAPDPCAKAKPEGVLAWIQDDYPAAIACAKARNLPLVLDLWAPWCHTCLSMQSTVFTDKSFAAEAPKFVFAALDTDRDGNAAAVAKFPPSAWPTFYVVGPDEAVLARFVGAASIAQFHAFLDTGLRARAGGAAGPDARLLAAERAVAAKDYDTADRELTAALAAAPADWPRRPDALVSLIGTKHKRKDNAGCLDLAEQAMDQTGSAASAADFLSHALTCAEDYAADQDAAKVARATKLHERAAARFDKLLADPAAQLSVDDRSDAMAMQRETLLALGRKTEANAVAEKQRALLVESFDKATEPMAAMTHIWPLAEVHVYLERPLELVPRLEKLARQLPNEYDPPARLGWLYFKAGKLDEAAQWTDKALALVYGPRKARVLNQRADIAAKAGDKPTERRFREAVVKHYESLPPSQVPPDALEKARKTLADLDAPPPPAAPATPAKK